jgi:hypothetical protein
VFPPEPPAQFRNRGHNNAGKVIAAAGDRVDVGREKLVPRIGVRLQFHIGGGVADGKGFRQDLAVTAPL